MPASTKQDNKAHTHYTKEEFFKPQMFKTFFEHLLKFDREDLMAKHRKNLSATTEVQKMAFEALKNVFQLQTQLIRHNFEEINASIRDLKNDPTSKEKLSAHANTVKKTMSKAIDHHSDISDILLKSNLDIYKTIQERFKENVESFKGKTAQTH